MDVSEIYSNLNLDIRQLLIRLCSIIIKYNSHCNCKEHNCNKRKSQI